MVKWNCRPDCGQCCGVIILPTKVYYRNLDRRQVEVTNSVESDTGIFALTDDLFCCFLNRTTKKCVIYSDRPRVCRIYGLREDLQCPYISIAGRERPEHEVRRILAIQERAFDAFVDQVRIRNEVRKLTLLPHDEPGRD